VLQDVTSCSFLRMF